MSASTPVAYQDPKAIRAFLKGFIPPSGHLIALDVALALLFGAQAWCLSIFFGALLMQEAPSFWQGAVGVGAFLVRGLLDTLKDHKTHMLGLDSATKMRQGLFDALCMLGVSKVHYGTQGALANYLLLAPAAMVGYVRFGARAKGALILPLILSILVMSQSLTAGFILILTAPLVPVFMILIGTSTKQKSAQRAKSSASLAGRFGDWLYGINTLSRLGALPYATQDIARASALYRQKTMDVLKIAFLNNAVLELLAALSVALVAVYLGFGLMGILPWDKLHVPVAYQGALFILFLVPEFYLPLRKMASDYHARQDAYALAPTLMPMFESAQHICTKNRQKQTYALSHAPAFCLVDVAVMSGERIRLAPQNLQIAQGARVALMAPSGAGKSTLLGVLLGFVPYQGRVLIDDVDYQTLDLAHLARNMGYFAQNAPILGISLADNLRLAKPDAQDEALWEVLELVGLSALVAQRGGLDIPLGARGVGLSGGQSRRLSLAQLLLQEAPVWLLDEPTEHLDEDTKTQISDLIRRLSIGKTLIWVTHQPPVAWLDETLHLATKEA